MLRQQELHWQADYVKSEMWIRILRLRCHFCGIFLSDLFSIYLRVSSDAVSCKPIDSVEYRQLSLGTQCTYYGICGDVRKSCATTFHRLAYALILHAPSAFIIAFVRRYYLGSDRRPGRRKRELSRCQSNQIINLKQDVLRKIQEKR